MSVISMGHISIQNEFVNIIEGKVIGKSRNGSFIGRSCNYDQTLLDYFYDEDIMLIGYC